MTKQKSPGKIADLMHDIREQRREIAKEDKALKTQYDELEQELLTALYEQDVTQVKSDKATASIQKQQVGSVQDKEKFLAWCKKTNRMYMLTGAVSQPAYREYVEQARGHKPPPGIEEITKTTISLRATK